MENKTHKAYSAEEKLSVQKNKEKIQKRFREELGLTVDVPKPGFGTSNDGNTARKALNSPELFADIVGVKVELILRLRNILIVVNSGYEINIESFDAYCKETSEYIVANYGWYVMPPTVHKLLEHGAEIANSMKLPLGQYSEEAQEAQNKEIQNARLNKTCKISRLNVMKNQYHYMLIRTDPVVSSISFKKHRNHNGEPLPEEVVNLLK